MISGEARGFKVGWGVKGEGTTLTPVFTPVNFGKKSKWQMNVGEF
jgi:hypothetical protein